MPRSPKIRASTGNAVTDIDAPMNNANGSTLTPTARPAASVRWSWAPYNPRASSKPRVKGSTIELREILPAMRPLPLISAMSSSSPTMNMKMTRPRLATTVNRGADLHREQVSVEMAREQAEEGRTEEDAADDFADDGRLAQPYEEAPHQPGDDDDRSDRQEHPRHDELVDRHRPDLSGGGQSC